MCYTPLFVLLIRPHVIRASWAYNNPQHDNRSDASQSICDVSSDYILHNCMRARHVWKTSNSRSRKTTGALKKTPRFAILTRVKCFSGQWLFWIVFYCAAVVISASCVTFCTQFTLSKLEQSLIGC